MFLSIVNLLLQIDFISQNLFLYHLFKTTQFQMTFSFILFLFLFGLFTYLVMRQSVARVTRTPVWLLWVALMLPAVILSAISTTTNTSLPEILVCYFVVSTLLYWLLFRWGRIPPSNDQNQSQESAEKRAAKNPSAQITQVRPIERLEETQLRKCFPWSIYYVQNIEYRPQAVICRGQLRTDPTKAYQQIKANIEAEFGDRFLLIFQEGLNGKPIFVLVPNTQAAKTVSGKPEKLTRPGMALSLLLATLVTTNLVGGRIAGEPTLFGGLPYALGLMTILGTHELGHYFAARWYKIRTTLPYFIPMPFFLGTFGAFIQMRGPVPNRKALFDVSIAGPIAGFIVTIPILLWGLLNSSVVPSGENAGLFNFGALNPRDSILLGLFAKLALGSSLTATSAIDLHPIAVAGFLGLIVTALNLIPVGQLDGGHIAHAIFGQRTSIVIGQFARLLLILRSLAWRQPEFFLWALILLFMPLIEEPALDDVTDLDNMRDFWGLLTLVLLILIVLPFPQFLANYLQI